MIKEHKKNEKEQKKLVNHLRIKYNEEGKQLSQFAKSKTVIEVGEGVKSEQIYEVVEKPIIKGSVRKLQVIPGNEKVEPRVFEERSMNLNE